MAGRTGLGRYYFSLEIARKLNFDDKLGASPATRGEDREQTSSENDSN